MNILTVDMIRFNENQGIHGKVPVLLSLYRSHGTSDVHPFPPSGTLLLIYLLIRLFYEEGRMPTGDMRLIGPIQWYLAQKLY